VAGYPVRAQVARVVVGGQRHVFGDCDVPIVAVKQPDVEGNRNRPDVVEQFGPVYRRLAKPFPHRLTSMHVPKITELRVRVNEENRGVRCHA
jgi:hypothetical protein